MDIQTETIEQSEWPADTRVLYQVWHEYNSAYFKGELKTPIIELLRMSTPKFWAGMCIYSKFVSTRIVIDYSIIEYSFFPDKLTHAKDVLLHEMVHQYMQEVKKQACKRNRSWHAAAFARECNRIGGIRGLPMVRSARIHKKQQRKNRPSCAQWPMNVYNKAYSHYVQLAVDKRNSNAARQVHAGIRTGTPAKQLDEKDIEGILWAVRELDALIENPKANVTFEYLLRELKKIGLPDIETTGKIVDKMENKQKFQTEVNKLLIEAGIAP